MKIKLRKEARVLHKAGEVVDTSPSYASMLIANGMAEAFVEEEPKPKKSTKKKVTE